MSGWHEGYNWTYEQFKRAVTRAFEVNNEQYVSLDVEHSDRKNMDDIIQWANELGYKAEERSLDIIRVWNKRKV